jgi:hypothetical protein
MGNRRIQPNGHVHKTSAGVIPDFAKIGDGGPASETICGEEGGENNGVAFDADGNLYCSTGVLLRIRAIRFGAVLAEPGSSVTASAGTDQSAAARTEFAMKLEATVRSPAATLENGIRVDFVAPSAGPSCTLTLAPHAVDSHRPLGSRRGSCRANALIGPFVDCHAARIRVLGPVSPDPHRRLLASCRPTLRLSNHRAIMREVRALSPGC